MREIVARAAEEQRLTLERSLEPMRESLTKLQLEQQAAQLGGAQYMEQLVAAQVDLAALAQGIEPWSAEAEETSSNT
mgnify:CR=1 FL=1